MKNIIEPKKNKEVNVVNERNAPRKYRYKVTIVGDGKVGKTSLIKKYTEGSFKKEYIKTLGAQFYAYETEINCDKIRLLFWDIAGQDKFHFLQPNFFKNSKAAIIVYSLEENQLGRESFRHISDWYNTIIKYCGEIPIVLFANKVDLLDENQLDRSSIQDTVNKNSFLGYYITSAKTGKGVIKAFNAIIEALNYKTLITG
ncbi:MAG: Rab family GTPase [Candidatus Thorarchaeota archaeon]